VPKIGAWTHQLYVTLNYDYYTGGSRHEKPHFYNAAYDSSGVELEFYRRSADVVSVSSGGTINMQEEVIITLPDGYLKEHQAGGLNIKLYGKNGSAVCCIPSAYVMAFLQKLSELETVAP
jgi:hypothetical protein